MKEVIRNFSLRGRLLSSYILLLIITFTVITIALLVFIGARPASVIPIYERLSGLLNGMYPKVLLQDINSYNFDQIILKIEDRLTEFSRNRDTRILWVYVDRAGNTVIYDSSEVYKDGDQIELRFDKQYQIEDKGIAARGLNPLIYGSFKDVEGMDWLFGGVTFITNPVASATGVHLWMVAEEQQTISFVEALRTFYLQLFIPLAQAAIVGIVVAVIFAAWISRSIARPLQALAGGASAVAKGDLHHYVIEEGPPETRSVAHSFNQMTSEVRATQESQRDFLANVSHDLKTPLTSIQGYSQAIVDGATSNPAQAASIIYEESERLNRMVGELTDLMRLQSGRLSMKLSAINLEPMVEAIGNQLSMVALQKQQELIIETSRVPNIAGDGDRLVQILHNLIGNAIKYTPEGGKIRVSIKPEKGGIIISIADTGIGIPREDLGRVFERFYQVDKARGPQRGTGLGLAITQEIVQAHGGEIFVESAGIGKGSTFKVWLPIIDQVTLVNQSPHA
ncbi:hypothetical protein MASR2M15_24370 [Anaerolineales bacterium]